MITRALPPSFRSAPCSAPHRPPSFLLLKVLLLPELVATARFPWLGRSNAAIPTLLQRQSPSQDRNALVWVIHLHLSLYALPPAHS